MMKLKIWVGNGNHRMVLHKGFEPNLSQLYLFIHHALAEVIYSLRMIFTHSFIYGTIPIFILCCKIFDGGIEATFVFIATDADLNADRMIGIYYLLMGDVMKKS